MAPAALGPKDSCRHAPAMLCAEGALGGPQARGALRAVRPVCTHSGACAMARAAHGRHRCTSGPAGSGSSRSAEAADRAPARSPPPATPAPAPKSRRPPAPCRRGRPGPRAPGSRPVPPRPHPIRFGQVRCRCAPRAGRAPRRVRPTRTCVGPAVEPRGPCSRAQHTGASRAGGAGRLTSGGGC